MSIDRQKLVDHLEFHFELLQYKIDEHAGEYDFEIVLMWFAKRIMLTQLLDDLGKGKFDLEGN